MSKDSGTPEILDLADFQRIEVEFEPGPDDIIQLCCPECGCEDFAIYSCGTIECAVCQTEIFPQLSSGEEYVDG